MAATGVTLAFLAGCVILVLGQIFLTPLARLLGSTDTILPYARSYLRIILLGAPYMTASFVLNNQLRFQGSAAYGMVGIAAGAVLNVGLDPLLIFGLNMGGWPERLWPPSSANWPPSACCFWAAPGAATCGSG